ncbi:MAG: Hsp33 family molecular chaperone HslO [Armatimonadetes bacterium]|nr:Hsp33 family molecular chaperone HslO [Armatimonadota bacterium]
MTDALLRAIAAEGSILACAVIATGAAEEARRRHGTLPTATAALGRALAAVAMLGSGLKPGQSVTLRILGDGPLGPVVADCTAEGAVRGYVANPIVHFPPTALNKLDVGAAVGRSGTVHVTRDLGLRDTYQGSVPLVSGEVGEDLAAYLVASEQVPSAVAVGVLVAPGGEVLAAGGWMLQVLPGAPAAIPAFLEERVRALQPVTQMISAGATPDEMLHLALGDLPMSVLERRPVRFSCRCSQEKVARVLIALGRPESDRLLREQGMVEVRCRFCEERYELGADQIAEVFALSAQPAGEDGVVISHG